MTRLWLRLIALLLLLQVTLTSVVMAAGQRDTRPRQQLAYYSHRHGQGHILLVDVRHGLAVRLLRNDPYVVSIAWSPDGETLAFIAYDNMGVYRPYLLLDIATRQLRSPAHQTSSNEALHWSADGRWLAFNSYNGPRPAIYLIDAASLDVRRMQPEGLLWHTETSWSPAGTEIAFAGRGSDSVDIYTMDATCPALDCAPRVLIDHPASDRLPAWSPDQTRLAFVSDRSGETAIYVQAIDCAPCDDEARHIADLNMLTTSMVWAPEGDRLAFTTPPRAIGSAIFVADMTCTDCDPPVYQITGPAYTDSDPAWSPDGTMLAYVSRFLNVDNIAVMDVRCVDRASGCAGERRLLTRYDANVWSPAWRP